LFEQGGIHGESPVVGWRLMTPGAARM